MRGIPFMLASALVVAGFAAATADEPVAPAPIKLALFPFELEDFSAAAAYHPPDDIDREQLRLSTEEARRLIAESGRYKLVDVSAVNDEAAKAGKLHDCDGCEAKIAAGVHADQSMIGIVTRISRTDYAVTYKISRRPIRSAGRRRADRPARGRQFGLEPWRALADPAPSAGKGELKHDPEKWAPVFPRDKREAFARRSCSNKKIERDGDLTKSHPALAPPTAMYGTARLNPIEELA